MNAQRIAVGAISLLAAAALGWFAATRYSRPPEAGTPTAAMAPSGAAAPVAAREKKVLYWYDPMTPQQHFDKPGKSPFMDMQLVPKYAEDDETAANSVRIDPAVTANLGVRLAKAAPQRFATLLDVPATVGYDERDVSIVQTRSAGFVERTWPLAVGDLVKAGAPLAELLVPEWGAAQYEFIALLNAGETNLARAARDRLALTGMPADLIARVEREKRPRSRIVMVAQTAGVLQELGVRPGMSLPAGATVARIGGIARVWVEAAVPDAKAAAVSVGSSCDVRTSDGAPAINARVVAILPEVNREARTLRVRVELPNAAGRFRPGQPVQVHIASAEHEVLAVPSEAIVRDGTRALVLVNGEGGHYRPTEVVAGEESNGWTQIVSGLAAGQEVVASGQFLIDSEANLKGVLGRMRAQDREQ